MAEPSTGRALDVAVAERVLGLRVVARDWPCGYPPSGGPLEASYWPEGDAFRRMPDAVWADRADDWPPAVRVAGGAPMAYVQPVPRYSSDWAAAGEVLERLGALGYHARVQSPFAPGKPWWCGFTPHGCSGWNGRPDYQESGATGPEAICRAALATVDAAAGEAAAEGGEAVP